MTGPGDDLGTSTVTAEDDGRDVGLFFPEFTLSADIDDEDGIWRFNGKELLDD